MTRFLICLVLCLAAPLLAADQFAAELKKFEGNWGVVEFEFAGKKVDSQTGAPEKATVKNGVIDFSLKGQVIPHFSGLLITIREVEGKRLLNLTRNGNETLPCLYEFNEPSLKIAMPMVSTVKKAADPLARPDSFETKDKPVVVMTLKRQ